MTQIVKKTKATEHPLEEVFDITPNTTMVEYKEVVAVDPVIPADYDEKDKDIEVKLEEIYNMAIEQSENIGDSIGSVEGKYKARMGEVTATMLNVALGAVRERRELKKHKDGMRVEQVGLTYDANGKTVTNNNLIVADRNEILEMLRKKNESK